MEQYTAYVFVSIAFVVCVLCLCGDSCDAIFRGDDAIRDDAIRDDDIVDDDIVDDDNVDDDNVDNNVEPIFIDSETLYENVLK
jgi:hypothetical protein